VAKLALLPNITATANGRASTPTVAAISNAIWGEENGDRVVADRLG